VTWTGDGQGGLDISDPIAVGDTQGDWRSRRLSREYATQYLDLVSLDRHALTAPMPALPAGQIAVDSCDVDQEASGQSLHDRYQAWAVGLTSG
jgi:hypothetical protein